LSPYIDQIYIPPLHLWVDDRRDVAHVRQCCWWMMKFREDDQVKVIDWGGR
jgi:hypothetical protein